MGGDLVFPRASVEDSLEYKVSRGLGFNDSQESLLKHLEDSLQHASQYPSSMYLETVQMLCGRKGGGCALTYNLVSYSLWGYIYIV